MRQQTIDRGAARGALYLILLVLAVGLLFAVVAIAKAIVNKWKGNGS